MADSAREAPAAEDSRAPAAPFTPEDGAFATCPSDRSRAHASGYLALSVDPAIGHSEPVGQRRLWLPAQHRALLRVLLVRPRTPRRAAPLGRLIAGSA